MSEMPGEIRVLRDELTRRTGGEVTVVAYLKPRPGKEDETRDVLLSLVEPTRREPGCIDYDLHRSNDDPCVFLFYENWRSEQDLDDHLAMPHLQVLFDRKEELLEEDIDVKLYRMTSPHPASDPS